jgi:hypothetical protein
MSTFKTLEVSIDLSTPGATPAAIEAKVAKLPANAKFLGSCATPSSVYLFFDVPGNKAPGPSTP